MDARRIAFSLRGMTTCAVRWFRPQIIVRMFQANVCVATSARIGLMNGSGQLGQIHKQRYLLAGKIRGSQGFVPVTFHA